MEDAIEENDPRDGEPTVREGIDDDTNTDGTVRTFENISESRSRSVIFVLRVEPVAEVEFVPGNWDSDGASSVLL